jgi:hypothetical protein
VTVTPTPGTFLSMIGGAQGITLAAPAQVLILAAGIAFNGGGGTNIAQFSLRVDGGQIQFQQTQLPPALLIEDGETFSFVALTAVLAAGAHTLDVLINSGAPGGISSLGGSGSLFFQVQ